jgi:hypothetical protein
MHINVSRSETTRIFHQPRVENAATTPRLLVAYSGLHTVLFPVPIITIFWKDHIGMSLADIMLLQAIFSLAAVVLEFPSGYVADRLGHRTSLLLAAVLWVRGWLFYALGTVLSADRRRLRRAGCQHVGGRGCVLSLLHDHSWAADAHSGQCAAT